MSYQHSYHAPCRTTESRRLNEFVPSYQAHSDYLPTNRVSDSNQPEAQRWLSTYEDQKRQGHVYTQRPSEFNPQRYVSVQTYENVKVGQPISENEFNSRVRR